MAGGLLGYLWLPVSALPQVDFPSIQVTTLTAKYLIDAYYGEGPKRSYWVGCSTGGRQGMVMSQTVPQ